MIYRARLWAGRRQNYNVASDNVCLLILPGIMLVAYCLGVERENETFWLFQNYVKSDLMSNNMKMRRDLCILKSDT